MGLFGFLFVNFKVAPGAYTRGELAWTSLFRRPNTRRFDSAKWAELQSSTMALPSRSKGSAAECCRVRREDCMPGTCKTMESSPGKTPLPKFNSTMHTVELNEPPNDMCHLNCSWTQGKLWPTDVRDDHQENLGFSPRCPSWNCGVLEQWASNSKPYKPIMCCNKNVMMMGANSVWIQNL